MRRAALAIPGAAAAGLCALALGWRASLGGSLSAPRLASAPAVMCGDEYIVPWDAVDGAVEYELEWTSLPAQAGRFCRILHPFDARACACDERGIESWPARCWDGATRLRTTRREEYLPPGTGWALYYRVRAVDARGRVGPASSAVIGCWLE